LIEIEVQAEYRKEPPTGKSHVLPAFSVRSHIGDNQLMQIHIPTPLRAYTDKHETVSVEGATVSEGLAALIAAYPAMQANLYTPEGKLRSFVNLYLNDDDVRYLPAKEDSPVSAADELTIIPSIAGGCCR
jgi:adenylyltransferase/sulfurtransferase